MAWWQWALGAVGMVGFGLLTGAGYVVAVGVTEEEGLGRHPEVRRWMEAWRRKR